MIAESSVFDGPSNNMLRGYEIRASSGADTQGYIFTDGENIYNGGYQSSNNLFVFDPGDTVTNDLAGNPVSRPTIPYDISAVKMETSLVQAYCEDNAGVNGANIIDPTSSSTGSTLNFFPIANDTTVMVDEDSSVDVELSLIHI